MGFSIITSIAPGKKLVAFDQDTDSDGILWYRVHLPVNNIDIPHSGWVVGDNQFWMQPDFSTDRLKLTGTDVLIRKFAGGVINDNDLVWILNTAGTQHDYASTKINQEFALISSQQVGNTTWYKVDLTNNCKNGPNGSTLTQGWISGDFATILSPPPPGDPSIDIDPGSLSFGNVQTGSSSQLTFNINNTGTGTLNISSISKPSWISLSWSSGTIAPNGSQPVTATFSPTQATNYNGTITINSDAVNGDETIGVSGAGSNSPQPAITLSGNLNFGEVQVGSSPSLSMIISNSGSATLNISSISTPSWIDLDWTSGSIAPNFSQTVNITFSPSAEISYSGEITVNSNASSGDNDIDVSGIGTSNQGSGLVVQPSMLNFGDVPVGIPVVQTLNLYNNGLNSVNVSSITVPPGFSTSSSTFGFSNTFSLSITFSPSAQVPYSGNIVINSNDPINPVITVPVSGNGTISNSNDISGIVKNVSINSSSSYINESPISSGVTIRLTDGNSTLAVMSPESDGTFTFSGFSGSGYNIEVEFDYLGQTYYASKTNISTGNNIGEIKVPAGLLREIKELRDDLNVLFADISSNPPGLETVAISSYDASSVNQVLSEFNNVDDNFNNAVELLARLYLAEKAVLDFHEMTISTGDLTTLTIFQMLESVVTSVSFFERLSYCFPNNFILNALRNLVSNTIYKATNLIIDAIVLATGDTEFGAFIESTIAWIRATIEGQLNLAFLPFSSWGDDFYVAIFDHLNESYIDLTQGQIGSAAANTLFDDPSTYDLSLTNAFVNSFQAKLAWENKTNVDIAWMQSMVTFSDILGFIGDLADVLDNIGGPGECSIGSFISNGFNSGIAAINAIDYASLGYGVARGRMHHFQTVTALGNNINDNVFKTESDLVLKPYSDSFLSSSLQDLIDALNNFDQTFSNLLLSYQQGSQISSQDIEIIQSLENDIALAINQNLYPIFSVSSQADTLINDYSDLYYFQLLSAVSKSINSRAELYAKLLLFSLDQSIQTSEDELVEALNETNEYNNQLPIVISQFHNLVQDISSPPFPVLTSLEYLTISQPTESQQILVKVENFGTSSAENVYLKIIANDGFITSTDSINLGTLPVKVQQEVTFNLISPPFDTIGKFQVLAFFGEGIPSDGKGGAILVRDSTVTSINSSANIDNAFEAIVFPNPNKGKWNLGFGINKQEDIKVILSDVSGMKVWELQNKTYPKGEHLLELEFSSLPVGIYFLTIESSSRRQAYPVFITK
ncbi:MAG: choice-of-anchor D domain-containing protein [Bacteroidota bacterium]